MLNRVETLLRLLTRAVVKYYTQLGDLTAPSVIVSQIPEKSDAWYVSVVRYEAKYAADKKLVVSTTALRLENALENLARLWYEKVYVNQAPLEDLKTALDTLNASEKQVGAYQVAEQARQGSLACDCMACKRRNKKKKKGH